MDEHVFYILALQVLQANDQWAQGFDKPMKLGVNKKVCSISLAPHTFTALIQHCAKHIRHNATLRGQRARAMFRNLDCE